MTGVNAEMEGGEAEQPLPEVDLSGFLPYRIMVAAERLSAGLASRYRDEFGISVAEWRVLVHIADAGAVSVREIHRQVHLEKSKASRAATRLESSGYVRKGVNANDRRLVALTLTARGRALMAKLLPIAIDYQERLDLLVGPNGKALDEVLVTLIEKEV